MQNKPFISEQDIIAGLNLKKLKISVVAPLILKLLKLKKVNDIVEEHQEKQGWEFANDILQSLKIEFDYNPDDLKNIPKDEPFILLANHPYGGIDGLILLSLIGKIRPDFKIMANYLLEKIPAINKSIIAINPFEKRKSSGLNMQGIKQSLKLIQNGDPIGVFPAGEVSSLKIQKLKITDKQWNPVVGKLIMKSNVKVIPVYFSGHNSFAFHLLGIIHPFLRTIKLPSELFNKKFEKIKVRIGKPVSIKTIGEFNDPDDLLRFLRARTYALNSALEVDSSWFVKPKLLNNEWIEPIIAPIDKSLLEVDIERIKSKGFLCEQGHLKVYVSGAKFIPNILMEIARLREITFRQVGEGTNLSCDKDEFDIHYRHLFIWDEKEKRIAGAYRLGMGNILYRRYKKKGFYLNTLFKMKVELADLLKDSIELGRSFVVKEYQKKPFTLMLLWKGIIELVKRESYPFKYLIGPVSISNHFNSLSKDLLVDYIQKNHFNRDLAKLVEPRHKYKFKHKGEGAELRLHGSNSMLELDQLIEDIEVDKKKIPVLLKKYIKQHAQIIAFNVDPKFNHALDGFLVMEINNIPEDTFEMIIR